MPRPLLRELAITLLQQTNAGKVKWTATAVKTAFRVNLGTKTVQLRADSEWNPSTGDSDRYYVFEVLDEKDESIDSITAAGGDDYKILDSLYDEARSNALGIDDQLSELLKGLKEGQ